MTEGEAGGHERPQPTPEEWDWLRRREGERSTWGKIRQSHLDKADEIAARMAGMDEEIAAFRREFGLPDESDTEPI